LNEAAVVALEVDHGGLARGLHDELFEAADEGSLLGPIL
jgi:hypothetical protein